MKPKLLSILVFALALSMLNEAKAQRVTYHSEHLAAAARKLNLESQIDTLPRGVSYIDYGGQCIVVEVNADYQVEHMGFPLFPPPIKRRHPSPVYNFVEYALLDNTYRVSDNPFVYSNVKFQHGGWRDMLQLGDTTSFLIDVVENKYYKVVWTDSIDATIVEMTFPVSYDMLAGSDRKEMEQNFVRDLRRYVGQPATSVLCIDSTRLQAIGDSIMALKGTHYILPAITDDTYYVSSGDSLRWLISKDCPEQTLANMILIDDTAVPECDINLKFALYAGASDSLLLPMRTFMRYCRSKGTHAYFGVEKNEGGSIQASLFFYNNAAGYDHVVYLNAPVAGLLQTDYTISGTMYLYAPTSNVENLFYNSGNKKKKNIKYEN